MAELQLAACEWFSGMALPRARAVPGSIPGAAFEGVDGCVACEPAAVADAASLFSWRAAAMRFGCRAWRGFSVQEIERAFQNTRLH